MSDAQIIKTPGGTVTVPAAVLARIVVRSAERVEGARVRRPRRGLEVEIDGGEARVSLELAVRFGFVLPAVARDVQARVGESLRSMCGIDSSTVSIAIEELDT